MGEGKNNEFPYQASVIFKSKYLQDGLHVAVLPMDVNLTSLIGLVTVYWCYFETMLNQLIDQMLNASERTEKNWQRWGYGSRAKLARKLLNEVTFPLADLEGKHRIKKCLDDATDLQWRRNMIVHGSYRMTVAAHSSAAAFEAFDNHNGKLVTIALDPNTLEKLWHDIAHLAGEFIELAKLLGQVEGLVHTFPDKHILDLERTTN